jgi:hypothetical protein
MRWDKQQKVINFRAMHFIMARYLFSFWPGEEGDYENYLVYQNSNLPS